MVTALENAKFTRPQALIKDVYCKVLYAVWDMGSNISILIVPFEKHISRFLVHYELFKSILYYI